MPENYSFTQLFRRRYKISLLLTVCLISFIFLFAILSDSASQSYGTIINKAGEQRMLSQRILLLTKSVFAANSIDLKNKEAIHLAGTKLLSNHRFIKEQITYLEPSTAAQIWDVFRGEQGLDTQVPLYSALLLELVQNEQVEERIKQNIESIDADLLLQNFHSVVVLLEQASVYESETRQQTLLIIWFLTLASLFGLQRLFFKPTSQWIEETYESLITEQKRVQEYSIALDKHAIVFEVDAQAIVVKHNNKFIQVYGYRTDEITNCNIDVLLNQNKDNGQLMLVKDAIKKGRQWHGELSGITKDKRIRWFTTTIVPKTSKIDKNVTLIIIQSDITEQKLNSIALKRLHQISSNKELSLERKIQALLKTGCELFNLPFGVLVELKRNSVLYSSELLSEEVSLNALVVSESDAAYKLLQSDRVIANPDISSVNLFERLPVKSYLSCPIWTNGHRFGTLCFFNLGNKAVPLSGFDKELIRLVGGWIANEISTEQNNHELVSQKQLMDQMSKQALIGAWEVDFTSNTLFWSDMTKVIHEVPPDFVPDINTAINFYKEGYSRNRINELIQESLKTGESYREELQLVTAKGREIWVEAYGQCEFENGVCHRMYGSFQDITAQVETKKAIEQAKLRLEFVLEATEVGIWDWTIDTGQVVFNERWAEIVGYTLEELKPVSINTWMSLAHPDDLEKSSQELNLYWNGERENYTCESRMKHKNGYWVWVLDTGKVVEWNDDGTPKRMIGTHLDISQSKHAELEIKDSNQRMRLAADSAGIGIFDFDVISEEIKWDEWMHRLYGLNANSFSGQLGDWLSLIDEEDRQRIADTFRYAVIQHNKINCQFKIRTQNGDLKHLQVNAFVKQDDLEEVTNIVGVNYDISERIEHEKVLTEAKIKAEAAVKAKNEFLASMSHEIRTPMNGVIGMLDLVRETDLSKDQEHYVGIAQSSANALLTLINDILDFSKIDANKLDLEEIPFDLTELINEVAESFAVRAESKGLELFVDTVEVDTQFVMGDPVRIRQILMNLIGNAIKFTHKGEIVVTGKLLPCDAAGKMRLHLGVSDTGIGIEFNKQQQVFELFSQVDSSTTRHYGGTGLGLAIVKRLCTLMNGDIRLISSPNVGSEFICDIEVGETDKLTPMQSNVSLENLNVLVVDDNETNRDILFRQLSMWGASVTLAADAKEAWTICQRHTEQAPPFDVAIIDMQMPEESGAQLAERIKADPRLKPLKLIMMTSMQMRGDLAYFAKIGFIGYFPKPVSRSDLHYALKIIVEDGELFKQAKPLLNTTFVSEVRRLSNLTEPKDRKQEAQHKLKVLLVEDNKVNQIVAKGIISKLGHSLSLCENGREAVERLSEESLPFDLILMDVQMPEMDGYDATKAIRQGVAGAQHQATIIIAMTANAMQGDKEKCLEAGMDEYVSKPINIDALRDKIGQFYT